MWDVNPPCATCMGCVVQHYYVWDPDIAHGERHTLFLLLMSFTKQKVPTPSTSACMRYPHVLSRRTGGKYFISPNVLGSRLGNLQIIAWGDDTEALSKNIPAKGQSRSGFMSQQGKTNERSCRTEQHHPGVSPCKTPGWSRFHP